MKNRNTILIVDDMEVNRAILCTVFEDDYNILEAENGEQAMMLLEQYHGQTAAVLLDLIMPAKNGYQVMEEMRTRGFLNECPVVVITAEDSVESEVKAFDLGALDIIVKPFEPHVVRRRVHNIVELNMNKLYQQEIIENQAARLRESNMAMIDALSSIIEYRSVETGQHIQRIRMFTKILLEDAVRCYPECGLDDRKVLIIAGASSMHDIGKIGIPDSILNKPGKLTEEEFEVMKQHTLKGCKMLEGLDRVSDREYLHYAYDICRYHHERYDGSGYPDGLKGEEIPLYAQVVGIADCYDALTTDRVYRKALEPELAFNMILNGECGVFSPRLLECFKNVRITFEQLSRKYADGTTKEAADLKESSPGPAIPDDTLNTLQMGQMKYFSLLHYLDSTVMEVDMDTGLYHLVYLSGDDFKLLKSGRCYEDSIRRFAGEAVHPDDREAFRKLLGGSSQEFINSGEMKRSDKFRIYHRMTDSYRWCRATLLRIDAGQLHQHRIMVVWKELSQEDRERNVDGEAMYDEKAMRNLLGGAQQCLNDRWFSLVQVSESFENLLGYTRQEIKEKFQNRFLNIIYPADREDVLKKTKEQLVSGNSTEMEYRVMAKDNRILWLLDKSQLVEGEDGREYLLRILIDITRSRKAQEELKLLLERYNIIMEQTNDIIFEWDIKADRATYSSNWEKKFGYRPIVENVSSRITRVSHVHPDDTKKLASLIEDMAGGAPYERIEFRLADAQGYYRWCKVQAVAQYNDMGKPFRVVGVLTDIDEEKRESQNLKDKAERDGLTKLFNKSTARRRIENTLEGAAKGERSAMLIIDVDDFKQINDKFGHMFGDAVLQEISAGLRRLFREEDIIARIGGDEFLVLLNKIPDIKFVQERVERVLESFNNLLHRDVVQCSFSCSIGIAVSPEDGRDFKTLFQNSDKALYHAKAKGKSQYVFFDEETIELSASSAAAKAAASTKIDSEGMDEEQLELLKQKVFRILYEAENMDAAFQDILAITGKKFSVSRAYIFEENQEGTQINNTFEWCNNGIRPRKDLYQNLDIAEVEGYQADFDEADINYCLDINKLPQERKKQLESNNVKSLLQCAIREKGNLKGFVGFDDCVMPRLWTQVQVDTLVYISRLLSTFLLKKRAQDALQRLYDEKGETSSHKQKKNEN